MCAGIFVAALTVYQSDAVGHSPTFSRIQKLLIVQKSVLEKFLTPLQISNFEDSDSGDFSVYIFPEPINGSVAAAVRSNCIETYCTTILVNLTFYGLPRSTVKDRCMADFDLGYNVDQLTAYGPTDKAIYADCISHRQGIAPTKQEGLSDLVQ